MHCAQNMTPEDSTLWNVAAFINSDVTNKTKIYKLHKCHKEQYVVRKLYIVVVFQQVRQQEDWHQVEESIESKVMFTFATGACLQVLWKQVWFVLITLQN